ncbi:class I SAM-dependent DNA methyltransferase [Rubellicoccus peritrichatus]|uniref:Methyltransferase domain-containing protein n=1 Tax=Rubellicoccus peritrichatus TaxID=3080537 RepID=A0AAQ3LB99_9BACT|nr:methyltransferase domain-containing protein [Puniceicoccus sp. CR14]WOO42680.1 methyltransferase domain-containing protein [Puniceicoccus sp. CR14]
MENDFNKIARQYVEVKQQAWRSAIEEYSFLKLIGDVEGLKVVDIACGQGYFTRLLKQGNPASICGFDSSSQMIKLARDEEKSKPMGIDYQVGDITDESLHGDFDLAVAAWLLVYAKSYEMLDEVCTGLARQLKSGGRFVTFTTNCDVHTHKPDYSKYGFRIDFPDDLHAGSEFRWSGQTSDGLCEVVNYYLPNKAYAVALEKAGFRDVKYHAISLSPQAPETEAYWSYFLQYPPAFMIDAVKS